MNCKFRACKYNDKENCRKYESLDKMLEDFNPISNPHANRLVVDVTLLPPFNIVVNDSFSSLLHLTRFIPMA